MYTLTETEKRLATQAVVMAIHADGFSKVEIHIFSEYARKQFPVITVNGIVELFRIYQSDPTI